MQPAYHSWNVKRNPVGVIQAVNKKSADGFTDADESLIQLLADQSGVAIQRYRLQEAAMEGVALRREMDLARTVQEAALRREQLQLGWRRLSEQSGWSVRLRCSSLWGNRQKYPLMRVRTLRMFVLHSSTIWDST